MTLHHLLPAIAICFVAALPLHAAGPYAGADLYTLPPPITNPGGGYVYGLSGSGYFAAGGQVVTEAVGPASATLYLSPTGTAVNLLPTSLGYTGSYLSSTNADYQVGNAGFHAILWHGTANSAVDLGPGNAVGISPNGAQQVGYNGHALLWTGTADSAVDLHPTNLATSFLNSGATATNGIKQVGEGIDTAFRWHALMWSGTADSTVDLDPTNLLSLTASSAMGVSPNGAQQVGYGALLISGNQFEHAIVWSGSANSAVDLNPAGFDISFAVGTNGAVQVGFGNGPTTGNDDHALLWTGTTASVQDLNSLLPFAAVTSDATSIDLQGNIFGTATDSNGNVHAVEWSVVPEPAGLSLLGIAASILLGRRSRSSKDAPAMIRARRRLRYSEFRHIPLEICYGPSAGLGKFSVEGRHYTANCALGKEKMRRTKCNVSPVAALAAAVTWAVIASITTRACAAAFTKIADTTTIAPGHGAFVGFAAPSLSGDNVAFLGGYGSSGIYTGTVGTTGVAKIAENGDIAGPGPGVFSSFSNPSVSGSNLAISGGNNGGGFGIYTGTVAAVGNTKIADTTTGRPGGGVFIGFGNNPSISGSTLAFRGDYNGGRGIYTGTVGVTGATKVVDGGNTAPGHGAFTDFGHPAISGNNLAFPGSYRGGSGLYTGTVGATGAAKIVDTGDTAPGHGVFTGFADPSISGNKIGFN